ncbi:MAG TPA: polysaccharide biosynthesis protein, partial [Pseudomonas sp.]|nr:polysaccharide biosynthesis protein [Pseudomonas sp.]
MSVIDQPSVRRGSSPVRERLASLLHGSVRSKLLRNILTVVTGTAGAQAITLAFMPVITRIYGPEAYGVLGTFLSVTMMLIPVAALTYPIAIVLPKRDGDARGLVRLALATALTLAMVVALTLQFFGDRLAAALEIQI